MNWDFTSIISILSLAVSGILAYSYLQIRLGLAEQILQVLNGRYLKKEVADEKFKSLAELEETRYRALVERFQNHETESGRQRERMERRLERLSRTRHMDTDSEDKD